MRKQTGATILELLYVLVALFGLIGWVANLVKVVHHIHDTSLTVALVLRIIGLVVPPLGAVIGYLDF